MERGSLSINSENMFPIIKKWLYSDHDIFLRELVSNGCDAITKLKKLDMMGDFEIPEGYKARIDVVTDPEEKTIKVTDNGLGMTADEVREYINNIAFSGAEAFLAKYKDKASSDQIIGHFGLGFYSAFMVSDLVTIDTKSYQADAPAVHWECDGGSEYTLEETKRDTFGTTITLHLSDDCTEFANYYRVKEVLEKYCSFMPVEIYLTEANTSMTDIIKESERRPEDVVIEELKQEEPKEGEEPREKELKIRRRPELVNDIHPLWAKTPKDCTDEEYKAFYRKVFADYKEPLFWIHLNMDYPFNLKGILYFPKINLEYESAEGVIKLYNNQVFIADNIKEVIPEFLMLLKGVIDCPDLPLNVSRSALQNDGFVKKISDYITKKVADKLAGMCRTDKENYDKYWNDISPFIKYGCLKDDKFCKKMTDYILFRDLDGKYLTLPDALEVNKTDTEDAEAVDENGEKIEAEIVDAPEEKKEEEKQDRTIYYVTDEQQQSQYIKMFRDEGMTAVILRHNIDTPFITHLERQREDLSFKRIDADVSEQLSEQEDADARKEQEDKLTALFRKALENDNLAVTVKKLRNDSVASMMILSEESRRMQEMMKMYGMTDMDPSAFGGAGTLVLNVGSPLVKYLLEHEEGEMTPLVCRQLYDLAMLAHKPLTPEEMTGFIERSNEILLKVLG